ncbi:hypothetical protein COM97_26520 [Bacillus thuringiensis]|uniref:hypothetical protein n=1 Tax=Bacillus thuringiensis TaxID=1428 RepID=UPI000BEBBA8D|nr:hypothetical protein [Bacillus thuringiensis]PEF03565.1 hypothetical protein COM97_26520 [Bacillus thuringiensis]
MATMKMAILKATGKPIRAKRGQYAEDKTFGDSFHHTGRSRDEYEFVDVDISNMDGIKKYVVISQSRLEELQESEHELSCLESPGVDNWSGYGYAMQMMEEEE